eukprot:scaffold477441_cov15-Prasinocladus_malaysianus.AAC.1
MTYHRLSELAVFIAGAEASEVAWSQIPRGMVVRPSPCVCGSKNLASTIDVLAWMMLILITEWIYGLTK